MEVISVSGAVRIAIDGAWHNVKSGLNVFHGITGTGAVGLQLANGASITLKWIKLEQGLIATPFVTPNPAEELAKCKRFYNRISITETFYALTVGMAYRFSYVIQSMRIKPTVVYRQVYDYGISQEEALVKDDVATTVVVSAKAGKTGDCSIEGIISLDAEIY